MTMIIVGDNYNRADRTEVLERLKQLCERNNKNILITDDMEYNIVIVVESIATINEKQPLICGTIKEAREKSKRNINPPSINAPTDMIIAAGQYFASGEAPVKVDEDEYNYKLLTRRCNACGLECVSIGRKPRCPRCGNRIRR